VSLLPRTRGGALGRFLLGAVVVVALTATTTAVAALLQFNSIAQDIGLSPALKDVPVTLPPPGAPETLLLIGSDHRAGESYRNSNTDTMMLVRIDDNSQTINVMSVPRDLKVNLPGAGGGLVPQKLNSAYSIGGVRLLLQTLKTQVFPGLQVNHVLDVNFSGFSDLIDAIGCVYADVDHRYYNVSSGVNGDPNDFSSIDIQPGYQKLCGDNQAPTGALAFVRFRHTDTDIVRNARQQDFIRWTKQGYSLDQLLSDKDKLLRIFGKHVQTDRFLHTTDGLLDLFNLIVNADGLTVKSIPFPAQLQTCSAGGQTPCFVTASPAAEAAAYRKFITATTAKPKPANTSPAAAAPSAQKPHRGGHASAVPAGLVADPGDGLSQSAHLGHITMPVMYPKLKLAGAEYCYSLTGNCDSGIEPASAYLHSYPRVYEIHAPGGHAYPAYVFTLDVNSVLGRYYTVQGTTWKHPPILRSPSEVETVNGKKLFVYENGGKISLVAFHTPQAVYWISNTLDAWIGNSQMVALAASLTPAP